MYYNLPNVALLFTDAKKNLHPNAFYFILWGNNLYPNANA